MLDIKLLQTELSNLTKEHIVTWGIDASINSTGLCMHHRYPDGNIDTKEWIITPVGHWADKHVTLDAEIVSFVNYDKMWPWDKRNSTAEHCKLSNYRSIANCINIIIAEQFNQLSNTTPLCCVYNAIAIEGLSYASLKYSANSLDLAGLNTKIRDLLTAEYIDSVNEFTTDDIIHSIMPKQIKSSFIKGNAKKHEMYIRYFDITGNIPKSNNTFVYSGNKYWEDIADAYALAQMTLDFYARHVNNSLH